MPGPLSDLSTKDDVYPALEMVKKDHDPVRAVTTFFGRGVKTIPRDFILTSKRTFYL